MNPLKCFSKSYNFSNKSFIYFQQIEQVSDEAFSKKESSEVGDLIAKLEGKKEQLAIERDELVKTVVDKIDADRKDNVHYLTSDLLNALSKRPEPDIKAAVAWHPNTSKDVLIQLSDTDDFWVKFHLILNWQAPEKIFLKFIHDQDAEIRRYSAKYMDSFTATPATLTALDGLSKDPDKSVRMGVAANMSANKEILLRLSQDSEKEVRLEVARSYHCPAEILIQLSKENDMDIKKAVAFNRNTPSQVLAELSKETDSRIQVAVSQNKSTPPEILAHLAMNKPNQEIALALLLNPSTSQGPRTELVKTADINVKYAYAFVSAVTNKFGEEKTPPPAEVMTLLAKDPDKRIRAVAFANPYIPLALIEQHYQDPDPTIRAEIGGNPSTPIAIIRKLANDPAGRIRELIAGNKSTPVDILRLYKINPDLHIRLQLVGNPSTPTDILKESAKDLDPKFRAKVAHNPSTPPETLKILAKDPVRLIRSAASDNLKGIHVYTPFNTYYS